MPYVYMEELPEGVEEADVYQADEFGALKSDFEEVVAERDELRAVNEGLVSERDNLAAELDDAKTKFANAFLSSPQRAKQVQAEDARAEDKPSDFNSLFAGRNNHHAN